ncbi:glutamate 5-kinase [Apiospora arundinis]
MFSKKLDTANIAPPPSVLITPATACEDGGRCNRMDFILEAQHLRKFLNSWGREGETHKYPFPPCLDSFRLSFKAAKYIQRFAERDTSSRIVLSDGGSGDIKGNSSSSSSSDCCEPSPMTELAWWFSETLKSEKPERRVVRYFFGAAQGERDDGDKEALDFLYSLIWQLVKSFPHGQTSPQGVVVSAFPKQAKPAFTVNEFRDMVSKLDGTMATFDAGLDLLRACVQVAGDQITYVFDGLEPNAQGNGNDKVNTAPPRGYDPVLRVLFESSASTVHSIWVTTKTAAASGPSSSTLCKFQKDTGRPEKEFSLAPAPADLLLRSWRTPKIA